MKLEEQLKHLLSPEFQERVIELENQNQLLLEKLRKYKRELKKRLNIKKEMDSLKTQKKNESETLYKHLGDTQKAEISHIWLNLLGNGISEKNNSRIA